MNNSASKLNIWPISEFVTIVGKKLIIKMTRDYRNGHYLKAKKVVKCL